MADEDLTEAAIREAALRWPGADELEVDYVRDDGDQEVWDVYLTFNVVEQVRIPK
jgi:hypothetical protein